MADEMKFSVRIRDVDKMRRSIWRVVQTLSVKNVYERAGVS